MVAPGRESIVEKLRYVRNELWELQAAWNIAIFRHRVPSERLYETVSTATSLQQALEYLSKIAQRVNKRLEMLREQGEPIPEETCVDLRSLFQLYLDHPKGTTTGGWTMIKALPHIEEAIQMFRADLVEAEHHHNQTINMFIDAAVRLVQGFELKSGVYDWYASESRAALLREALSEAESKEAVWLDPLKEELSTLKEYLTDEDREASIVKCLGEVDRHRLWLFRCVSEMGLKIGRQTQLTEYFQSL